MTIRANNEYLTAISSCSDNIKAFLKALNDRDSTISWGRLEKDNLQNADGTFFTVTQVLRSAGEQIECFKKGREGVKYETQIFLFPNEYVKKVPATLYKLTNRGRVKDSAKVVTNAFAGESYHNWGLAVDLVLTKLNYDTSHKFSDGELSVQNYYKMIGLVALAKKFGLSWGGNWSDFFDIWHFEDNNYEIPKKEYWANTNMNFLFVEDYKNSGKLPAIVEKNKLFSIKSLLPLCVGLYGIKKILWGKK